MDEKTLKRYLNIKALADRGAEGERDNALDALQRMEQKHPGIGLAAAAYERQQLNPTPSPATVTRNWEEIFRYARGVWDGVAGFAETVVEALGARELAEQVEIDVRVSRADNLIISAKMTLDTFDQAQALDTVQRELFKREVRNRLENVLTELFEASDEEEEE